VSIATAANQPSTFERRTSMANSRQLRNLIFNLSLGAATAALAIAFVLIVVAPQHAQAQTYTVLHNFTGGLDGATPYAGLTIQGESLYGTATGGGAHTYGTVYRLQHRGSGWTFAPLYSFTGVGGDGAYPWARVVFGPTGLLHGTTSRGGSAAGGTVFALQPRPTIPPSPLTPWNETVLYNFPGGAGGSFPAWGDVIFDQAGNMYGTASDGGNAGLGVVWELTPRGNWGTETVLYTFSGSDGAPPDHGVILDSAGNLYGTAYLGGSGSFGTAFQVMPAGPPWTENILHNFQNGSDGGAITAGLIFDPSGNLYGAATNSGTGGGTVFELSPPGTWTTLTVLKSFTSGGTCPVPGAPESGPGPWGTLAMDAAGNLYGTTCGEGANNVGSVFELTPSNGGWNYTDLHDFTGGSDGEYPISNVVIDGSGNLYGTAFAGGSDGLGVVWEITP
jgi:uncharacterized repeat protein (TIGR03803 family)